MVLLKAKEATIYIGDSITNVSSSSLVYSQLTGILDFSGRVRDIEISGAESETEQVYLFGEDADGRQNAELDVQPMTEREFSGTLILTDNIPAELATSDATAVGATGFTRIQADGTITPRCLVIKWEDELTGDILYASLNNVSFLKMGDISLDSEGFATQEIMAKCRAKDYREEYKAGS